MHAFLFIQIRNTRGRYCSEGALIVSDFKL